MGKGKSSPEDTLKASPLALLESENKAAGKKGSDWGNPAFR